MKKIIHHTSTLVLWCLLSLNVYIVTLDEDAPLAVKGIFMFLLIATACVLHKRHLEKPAKWKE